MQADLIALNWQQMLGAIATYAIFEAFKEVRKKQAADALAKEVKTAAVEVAQQVDVKAAEAQELAGQIKTTVDATKVLVNSRHGKSLAVSVRLARRLVEVSDTPENREELARALAEQEEHAAQQDILDNQQ